METWKEFEQNPITHSGAHHLVAIAELIERKGYARVSDVARALGITRGSVSVTLKGMKQRGLVLEDESRFLRLSEDGEEVAQAIRAKRVLMKQLFRDILGVSDEQAEIDTCKIEHLISDETANQVSHLFHFLEENPKASKSFVDAFLKSPAAKSSERPIVKAPHEDGS